MRAVAALLASGLYDVLIPTHEQAYVLAKHLPPGYTRTHQQCRPTEATFELPSGERRSLEAENGSRFVIEAGGVRVEKG